MRLVSPAARRKRRMTTELGTLLVTRTKLSHIPFVISVDFLCKFYSVEFGIGLLHLRLGA